MSRPRTPPRPASAPPTPSTPSSRASAALHDAVAPLSSSRPASTRPAASAPHPAAPPPAAESMVRTQIYLSQAQHAFLQAESHRLNQPMAALLRSYVDEHMTVPSRVWEQNPLLDPPAEDRTWKGHPDGARHHDHYVYGTPKAPVRRS